MRWLFRLHQSYLEWLWHYQPFPDFSAAQFWTSPLEQGLIAIKMQAQKLPDDIDPVTESFKRLGIETKENLKLAAQQALMDFINVRDSGKATAEGVQKAYEKAAQSAAASGDAGRIAAINAMNAGRNLEVQIDETGMRPPIRSLVCRTSSLRKKVGEQVGPMVTSCDLIPLPQTFRSG